MIRIFGGVGLLLGGLVWWYSGQTPVIAIPDAPRPAATTSRPADDAATEAATAPTSAPIKNFEQRVRFISAAIELDDRALLGRAETLALEMIDHGSAADVLAVLPLIPQLREEQVPQESLCRLAGGFEFEVVKLKYNRIYPEYRPWNTVCKSS